MENKRKYRVDGYKIDLYMFENGILQKPFSGLRISRYCKIRYIDYYRIMHFKNSFSFDALLKIADAMKVDLLDILIIQKEK